MTEEAAGEAAQDPGEVEDPLGEIVGFVHEAVEVPIDAMAVAAFLESKGMRDVDAIRDFGDRHIFGLADRVHALVSERPPPEREPDETEQELVWWRKLTSFIYYYLKGMVFALPMTGQIIAILVLRYSLWAWLDFSVMTASLVAIGTISSFIVTGGIVQALGRENTYYVGMQNYILLERVCRQLLALGMIAATIVTASFIIFNGLFPYVAWTGGALIVLYFVLLTPLWLFLAILYSMRDNVPILAVTLLGTAVVHAVMSWTGWGIHAAHAMGLIAANLAALAWGTYRIRRHKAASTDAKYEKSRIPRPAVFFHIIKPFLVYGTLYFSMLFADRLIGWSASTWRKPLFIWFRTSYELGMDWALISLVLTIAVLEYTIQEFSRTLIPVQSRHTALDYRGHNRHFRRFYVRQRALLIVVSIISVVLTYHAVLSIQVFDHIPEVRDFFASPITHEVYWYAAIGYSLLALGLLNGLFFFSLSKPWVVVRCISWALLVDVVVGFICSRAISFEYSVLGLVAGALTLAILTSIQTKRAFEQLDYFYYSAF